MVNEQEKFYKEIITSYGLQLNSDLSIQMQQSLCCVRCETCEGLGSIEMML